MVISGKIDAERLSPYHSKSAIIDSHWKMTHDTDIGPGKRYAFPDLDMRLDVDFHGAISKTFKDMVLTFSATGDKIPYRVYSLNNHRDGCKHLAFTIPGLSLEHCRAFASFIAQYTKELNEIEIMTAYDGDPNGEMESTTELPWSNRVFIYTDYTTTSKSEILALFRDIGLKVLLTDDEKWKRMLSSKRPDIFLAHDSRDKDTLARPLAVAVSGLGLVAWYDEFSLKPGDRVSQSIDKGLTECRHAVLLVTPNFLENTSWTSVEMSTLLTREVTEKNLIIPVWSGVEGKAVAARSARLADLFAIREFADIDQLATRIFSVVTIAPSV